MSDVGSEVITETAAAEFGRALTYELAPEEVAFYDELVVAARAKFRMARDRPLGFGLEVDAAISGALFHLSTVVMAFIWENAKDGIGQSIKQLSTEATNRVAGELRRWAAGRLEGDAPVVVTEATLRELIKAVDEEARRRHISADDRIRINRTVEKAFLPK